MAHISDLLLPGSRISLTLLAGPSAAAQLVTVTTVEGLDRIGRAPRGALAVVTGASVAHAADYELDIAVRTAAERELPALALIGIRRLPVTAARLADRAGLAVLGAAADCDVADVVLHIDQVIRGDAAGALARAQAALRVVAAATPDDSGPRLVDRVAEVLGRDLHAIDIDERPSGATSSGTARGEVCREAIWVGERRAGWVVGPPEDVVRLVLPALAAALGRIRARALERAHAPGQTRADILAELIVGEREQAGALADRARLLGLAVDDRHTAVWLVPDRAAGLDPVVGSHTAAGPPTAAGSHPAVGYDKATGSDPAALAERRRLFDTLTRCALELEHPPGQAWNTTRLSDGVMLVGTSRSEIRPAAAERVIGALEAAVAVEHPGTRLRCGIGTVQRGIDGLRQSALEARAAAAIAARNRQRVRVFDATGINRVLATIAGSPLSRQVIDELLRPLDALGPARAEESIRTLGAYLDARGSLKAAAARLSLHPNAVAYRIRKIATHLGADLSDPDLSFALHLACRIRLHH